MKLLPCLALELVLVLVLALVLATELQPQEHSFKESHSLNWGKVSHALSGVCARCRALMSQVTTGSSGRYAQQEGRAQAPARPGALSLLSPCWMQG